MLLGSGLALVYRVWLQRRRRRPILRGYCPLGPGMVAGAMAVFVFVNAGGSLAAEPLPPEAPHHQIRDEAVPLPAPARPGPGEAMGASGPLAATELAPVRVPLPAELAAQEIAVDEAGQLPFAIVTGRIAILAGVRVEAEERPARVAGGALVLSEPPAMRLAFDGRLPGLLNRVAAHTGYDWTWRDGAIVFFRYWDVEQRDAREADRGRGRDRHRTGTPAVWRRGRSTGRCTRRCGTCSRTGGLGQAGLWCGNPGEAIRSAPTPSSAAGSSKPSTCFSPHRPRAAPWWRWRTSPTATW